MDTIKIGDLISYKGDVLIVVARGMPFRGWLLAKSNNKGVNFDPITGRAFDTQDCVELIFKSSNYLEESKNSIYRGRSND